MLITVQLLEDSLTVLSLRNIEKHMVFLRLVSGVIVNTNPRIDANAASGDRLPTASGDREQDIPDWLQPFTEGLVERESGSSGQCW